MVSVSSFPPLSTDDAKVLVLGSMPGIKSLEMQQYYAHPRNAFWPIMMALFDAGNIIDYQHKITLLTANKVALWDVLKNCDRPGSMDTAIDQNTLECNNFVRFFRDHPNITWVYFNGGAAEKFYSKWVIPLLIDDYQYLQYYRLPSTSPAHAAMSLAEKTEQWRIIQTIVKS